MLAGSRVLVVEDEALIAMGISAMLTDAEGVPVGPASSVREARQLAVHVLRAPLQVRLRALGGEAGHRHRQGRASGEAARGAEEELALEHLGGGGLLGQQRVAGLEGALPLRAGLARPGGDGVLGLALLLHDAAALEAGELPARVLVDASGQSTVLGKYLGLRKTLPDLKKVAYFGHFENVRRRPGDEGGYIVIVMTDDGWFWSIPLNETKTSIGLVMSLDRSKSLNVPQDQILSWAIELCDVLDYLHKHKPDPIIFRDMKPSNVMINHNGDVMLVDFGIAKTFQSGIKGTMIGTEGYSPPEQYRGEATPLADIYALGATLHHALTRRDPRLDVPR